MLENFLKLFKSDSSKDTAESGEKRGYALSPSMFYGYPYSQNQRLLTKPGPASFKVLRQISKLDAIIRICINAIKKDVSQSEWGIFPRKGFPVNENNVAWGVDLFNKINGNGEDFREMLDRLIEDLLILDIFCCEKVRNAKGELVELNSIDAATIRPKMNLYGELMYDTAYVQYINNEEVAKFPPNDLIRKMMNPQNDVEHYGWGMCVPYNTWIETNEGKKLIRDIVKLKLNLDVKSYDEKTGKIVYKKILNWSKRYYKDDLYKVEFGSGGKGKSIRCTKDHPILTTRGYIKAQDIRLDDKLLVKSPVLTEEQKEEQGVVPVSIKSISVKSYSGSVYDIEVEGTHNFLINGAVVHNSPIEGIMMVVNASLGADIYNTEMFAKDNIPAGILDLGDMSEIEARKLEALWNASVIGNTQKIKFLFGGSSKKNFFSFSKSNKDMQYIEYVDWLSRLKLSIYGLSSMDANITQDVNRSTSTAQREISASRGVRTVKKLLSEAFSKEVLWAEGKKDIEFRFEPYSTMAERKIQAEIDKIYIESGVYTGADVAKREGFQTSMTELEAKQVITGQKNPADEKNPDNSNKEGMNNNG